MNYLKSSLTVILILLFTIQVFPQKEANNWCFGQYRGITFNTNPPSLLYNTKVRYIEGCASISDTSGTLLFYSDGETIWNKNHDTLDGGKKLSGNVSTTQSCIIIPLPDSKNIYYIFTLDQAAYLTNKGFCFSIIDISLNNGLGKVISKNNLIYTPSSEKLHATLHKNGKDVWIVTHDRFINKFYAHLLTKYGLNHNPVTSICGTKQELEASVGYMKLSPSGTKLALTGGNEEYVETFDFDNCTGLVSNPFKIDFSQLNSKNKIYFPPQYGLEFSPNEEFLYAQAADCIFQLELKYKTQHEIILNSYKDSLNYSTQGLYSALQVGPDGKIYIEQGGSPYDSMSLAIIHFPNLKGESCKLNRLEFKMNKNTSGSDGLPNFLSSYFYFKEHIKYKNLCFKDSTILTLKNVDLLNVKSVNWFYSISSSSQETSFSNDPQPKFVFPDEGEYFLRANITTLTDSIYDLNTSLRIVSPHIYKNSDSVICKGDTLKLDFTDFCELTNTWKTINNDTIFSPTYAINSSGVYNISYNFGDCLVNDTINLNVIDELPLVNLGIDTALCLNQTDHHLINGETQFVTSYTWNDGSKLPTLDVKNSGTYHVMCENACGFNKDTINVEFEIDPIVSIGPDQEICESGIALLKPISNYKYYNWSDGSHNPTLLVNSTGNYYLTIGNSCGVKTDTAFVYVFKVSDLNTPNIITPNHDGLNEVLIVNKHLLGSKLNIYNRWGGICYTNEKYDNTWNANDLSDGVYYYEFEVNCFNKYLKGWIQVAR